MGKQDIRTTYIVLIIMAAIGIVALSVPWIVKFGFTWQTLHSISINFGIGILSGVLVIWLSQLFGATSRRVHSIQELVEVLAVQPCTASEQVVENLRRDLMLAKNLRDVGIERAYKTRESAYADIAAEISHAKTIHIISGSLYSFWSIYRELLLDRDKDPDCDLKVLLLNPDSTHAAVRASMDSRLMIGGQDMLAGYVATIRQIYSELKSCNYYDLCPPASLWLVDNKIYITPYFYSIRGRQGVCLQIVPAESGVFERLRQSIYAFIQDFG